MDLSWLLKWAPGLRQIVADRDALREAYRSIDQDKTRLEDRLIASEEERTRLWKLFEDTLKSERDAYQLHINMSMQRLGGGIPYPDAPHINGGLAGAATQQAIGDSLAGRKGRMTTSELIEQQTRRNLEEMMADVKAQGGGR